MATMHFLSEGKQQAEKLARSLLAEAWHPSHVYSSPLKRTAQTTQILLNHFQTAPLPAAVSDLIDSAETSIDATENESRSISVAYADALKEFQNGIFQGLTWAEAMSRYPDLCRQLEASARLDSDSRSRNGHRMPESALINSFRHSSTAIKMGIRSGLSPIAGFCNT